MTMPAPPWPGQDLEPGWTHATPNLLGPCYHRYVPDRGILRVTARPGRTFEWHLSYSPSVPLTSPVEGFTSARAAMQAADTQTALTPPGMFDKLEAAEAVALYLRLFRAERAAPGDPLGVALSELYRRIMVLSLAPGMLSATDPVAISSVARSWERIARSTGLRETNFDADELHAPAPARDHLNRAARHLLDRRPDDADQELNLAMHATPGRDGWEAIRDLRTRMNAATAADRRGKQVRQFDRVTYPVAGRREAGVVEWVTGANGNNGGRAALVYPEGLHLADGCWVSVPYSDLVVTARGTDPAGPDAARRYARYLPPGIALETADRAVLAAAIRHGQITEEGSAQQALAYHEEHHNAGASKDPIGKCPAGRCRTAVADWRRWADQAADWRNPAGQFTGQAGATAPASRRAGPARSAGTAAGTDAARGLR